MVALRDAPYSSQCLAYAFPASFNPRSTFSGLKGNFVILTPVALLIALAMAPIGAVSNIFLPTKRSAI